MTVVLTDYKLHQSTDGAETTMEVPTGHKLANSLSKQGRSLNKQLLPVLRVAACSSVQLLS